MERQKNLSVSTITKHSESSYALLNHSCIQPFSVSLENIPSIDFGLNIVEA